MPMPFGGASFRTGLRFKSFSERIDAIIFDFYVLHLLGACLLNLLVLLKTKMWLVLFDELIELIELIEF